MRFDTRLFLRVHNPCCNTRKATQPPTIVAVTVDLNNATHAGNHHPVRTPPEPNGPTKSAVTYNFSIISFTKMSPLSTAFEISPFHNSLASVSLEWGQLCTTLSGGKKHSMPVVVARHITSVVSWLWPPPRTVLCNRTMRKNGSGRRQPESFFPTRC